MGQPCTVRGRQQNGSGGSMPPTLDGIIPDGNCESLPRGFPLKTLGLDRIDSASCDV